jgi:predicted DsbA family dithiol-disulfide isomerase
MMTVELRIFTDPACEVSWAIEPSLRRLQWEFGEALSLAWVMGGLARTIEPAERAGRVAAWLEAAASSQMPCDPRLWLQNPISSTYPACQALIAAREQGGEAAGRYLRRLREGLLCERKRLDHAEALVAEAGAAGLDLDRFAIDLRSHAIVEAFGADLDATRQRGEPLPLPTLAFIGEGGESHELRGVQPYDAYRDAALAAGAAPAGEAPLEPPAAIERFGRCATREIEVLTGRPRPVVEAELWGLARDWRLKPVPVLTGTLWELP